MIASLDIPRRIDALQDLFAFTARTWAQAGLAPELLPRVDLVLEELFTNVVKYGGGAAPVRLDIRTVEGGVEVALSDPEARYFDVTRAPAVDTAAPVEQRRPGGLGLHLIRQLVDSLDYRYAEDSRSSCVTFRVTGTGTAARAAPQTKDENARD